MASPGAFRRLVKPIAKKIIYSTVQPVGPAKHVLNGLASAAFYPKLTNKTTSYAFKWLWSSPIDVVALFVQFYQPELAALKPVYDAFTTWQTAGNTAQLQSAAMAYQTTFAQRP